MNQQLYIISGSSRGMGEAMALQLLAEGHYVLGLARGQSGALSEAAQRGAGTLAQWSVDLSAPLAAAQALQDWLLALDPQRYASVSLINNAGVVTPPGPIEDVPLAQLSAAIRVGLEACLLLSSAFLRGTQAWPGSKRLLNISSGLGRRAMSGAAPYCGAKAGIDHLSRALALDEARKTLGAKVVSLAPGVIDTGMQVQLRAADPAQFPEQARFAELKAKGQLSSADDAACLVLAYLRRADFGVNVIADVREA